MELSINQAPTITSSPLVTAEENQTIAVVLDASDDNDIEEIGGGLIYSISGGVDADRFQVETQFNGDELGLIIFKSPPDFENPTDADADNNYELQVTVTDSEGLTDTQDVTISVSDLNTVPEFISRPRATVEENQTVAIQVTATDGSQSALFTETYSISGGADADLFEVDPVFGDETGVILFLDAPDFENPADADADNNYELQVTFTSSEQLMATQDVTISVVDVVEVGEDTNERSQLLVGTSKPDTISGDRGDDVIEGSDGNDLLIGATGDDLLYGATGNDTLNGGSGNDELFGGYGRDSLTGGNGDDTLFGEVDRDILEGGNGNDILIGGDENDTLIGGGGRDTFVLGLGSTDTIEDFDTTICETIELSEGLGFDDLSFSGEQIISDTDEVLAILTGVDTASLSERDFVSV